MDIRALKIGFNVEDRKNILKEIDEILEKGKLSQGEKVRRLEQAIADYTSIKHAIAVNTCTGGIEMSMRVLGVKGKTVLVPTNTFLASASGVLFAGGKVKLIDTDRETLSVTLEDIKKSYTEDTVGVIVVHIGGIITPEIEAIRDWCEGMGIWLFEDAAHAHGSTYNNIHAGGFGIAASYSLFATKIITSGEGGYILTNDDEMAKKLRSYRNHGKEEEWVTYHTSVGSNYRMNEITASIAYHQFVRLDEIIEKRKTIADYYTKQLSSKMPDIRIFQPVQKSSWYKYTIELPGNVDKNHVKEKMKEAGINLQGEVYGIPLHMQPIADKLNLTGDYPKAEYICRQHICLPIYPELTVEEADFIVDQLICVLCKLSCSA